jgi:hypothetical protein
MNISKDKRETLKPLIKQILIIIVVILLMSVIFALRYNAAFTMPNFYAEDGSVFVRNILEHNIFSASLTAFNGYLITGQYLIAGLAFIPYYLLGLSFSSLPLLVACASCLFLGATAALPFILFRKELGWVIALVTSIIIAFTPMPGSDFAIIGTIGNLKFAFLFWAVVFVIYRNIHYTQKHKVLISDVILLLCIMTNGPTAVLLPFILWPYRKDIILMIRRHTINKLLFRRPDVLSALTLGFISFLYVLVVYLKGIPEIPNYLQAPYILEATDNIIHRVTTYAWLFPVSKEMTDIIAMAVLLITLCGVFILNKKGRKIYTFGLFAIAISTLAFVLTRTGISEHMLNYEKTPDQFFYAQSMVFIFISMWVIAPYLKTKRRTIGAVGIASIFIISTAPYGSSFGENSLIYQGRGNIYQNTSKVCKNPNNDQVEIAIYPSETWTLKIDKSIACK